jgi:hypothetical protein
MAPVIKSSIIESIWKGYKKAVASACEFVADSGLNIATGGLSGALRGLAPVATPERKDSLLPYLDTYFVTLKNGGMPNWAIAIIKGILAAFGGIINIMSAASIMSEISLMRPLRKEFSPTQPDASQIIDGWRRGNYTIKERDEKLQELGYSMDDIIALVEQSWYIPQVQDIIRFAVREVYTPEIRAKFQQDLGSDEVAKAAAPWLLKAGIRPEVLKDYWAAHWELPSITQAYEMLHRGVITNDDIDMLLRAQDVMPFWREKMKAVSYNVFTRVDIRRMHKMGVLSDKELVDAHKNIGYNQIDAERLAQFVMKQNKDPETTEETFSDREAKKYKDLSVGNILKLYNIGIVTAAQVKQAFIGIGYSEEEANYLISSEDFKISDAELNKQLKYIKSAFLKGLIGEDVVTTTLGKFNLPGNYTLKTLEDLRDEKLLQIETPTKAEILAWFKKGWLSATETTTELSRMGYQDKWIKLYLEQSKPASK